VVDGSFFVFLAQSRQAAARLRRVRGGRAAACGLGTFLYPRRKACHNIASREERFEKTFLRVAYSFFPFQRDLVPLQEKYKKIFRVASEMQTGFSVWIARLMVAPVKEASFGHACALEALLPGMPLMPQSSRAVSTKTYTSASGYAPPAAGCRLENAQVV